MWSFLNPFFLWAGMAAVLPLVLHLMQRRRTVRIRFSTVRFLKIAQKRSASRVRMENFLLWLMRTLLILLLVLAFAGPVMRLEEFGPFIGSSRRDVAIVWDASFSMSYDSGSARAWDEARDVAASIVRGLKKGDRVCMFMADDGVTPLVEQPSSDLELALAAVRAQEWRPTSSQLMPSVMAACDALKDSGNREREVYIITDGQSLPWSDFRVRRDAGPAARGAGATNGPAAGGAATWDGRKNEFPYAFFVALVGAAQPENLSPIRVEVEPKLVMAGRPGRVTAGLSTTGPARNTTVSLVVDDRESDRRNVTVGAGGDEEVVFNLPLLGPGVHAARVETPADPVSSDDALHFLVRVRDQLPVLCVGSEADVFFLARALNPGGRSSVRLKRVAPDALSGERLADYTCVFLCNALPLPAQAILDVERFVRGGGTLALFPGERANLGDYEPWACLPARPKQVRDVAGGENWTLRLVKPGDPLFSSMKLPPGSVPTVAARRHLEWGPLEREAEPVLSAGQSEPFLLRRQLGRGHVLFFAVTADRRWSDLPLSPFFLPIAHQIVLFSSGEAEQRLFVWGGRTLNLTDILSDAPESASLLSPTDAALPIQRMRREEQTELLVENAIEPGIYRLSDGTNDPAPALAVNLGRRESDLTPISSREIPEVLGVRDVSVARGRADLERLVQEKRIGRPMAEILLWLALLVAALELFMANRASARRPGLTDKLVIEESGRVRSKPS